MRKLFGRWVFLSESLTFRGARGLRHSGREKISEQKLVLHRETVDSVFCEPQIPNEHLGQLTHQ